MAKKLTSKQRRRRRVKELLKDDFLDSERDLKKQQDIVAQQKQNLSFDELFQPIKKLIDERVDNIIVRVEKYPQIVKTPIIEAVRKLGYKVVFDCNFNFATLTKYVNKFKNRPNQARRPHV